MSEIDAGDGSTKSAANALTRLTWLEWLPAEKDGTTSHVAVLPSADAAQAAARVLNRYLPGNNGPAFEAWLNSVETTGPVVMPAGIDLGLVHASLREATAANFLSAAVNKQPKPLGRN